MTQTSSTVTSMANARLPPVSLRSRTDRWAIIIKAGKHNSIIKTSGILNQMLTETPRPFIIGRIPAINTRSNTTPRTTSTRHPPVSTGPSRAG